MLPRAAHGTAHVLSRGAYNLGGTIMTPAINPSIPRFHTRVLNSYLDKPGYEECEFTVKLAERKSCFDPLSALGYSLLKNF